MANLQLYNYIFGYIKWLPEKLLFFLHSSDNKFLCFLCNQTLHKPWLGFLAPQLFLDCISPPYSRDLQIDWYCFHSWDSFLVRASRQEDSKNTSDKKNYKLKPIQITLQTTFWSKMQVLIEVCFKYYYSFRYPKPIFVFHFFHI